MACRLVRLRKSGLTQILVHGPGRSERCEVAFVAGEIQRLAEREGVPCEPTRAAPSGRRAPRRIPHVCEGVRASGTVR